MTATKRELLERVGAQLRAVRLAQGRTQEEVAERAGFTGKYISEIERGHRDVPLSTLARLAEQGLGVGLTLILEGAPTAPSPKALSPAVRDTAELLSALPPLVRRSISQMVSDVALALSRPPAR